MSNSNEIHLLFSVPEGLEFIAAQDIESSLDPNLDILENPKYSWEKKTGRVYLICRIKKSLNQLRDYMMHVSLLSIYSVTLIASESTIPPDIFAQIQPTYDFIIQKTKETLWHNVIQEHDNNDISFRATFKKEHIRHKAPSQQIAGCIGSAFSDFFPHWKVKMTDYNYEIMSLWFQTTNETILSRAGAKDQTSIILVLGVTIPLKDQRQRNRVFVGRTSLNPCIAYCLAQLANPEPGQIILDMCCGTGTIPIEGASKFKDTFWIGGEVQFPTLAEKALGNLKHCKINNVDLMLGDGRKMCYRPGVIDSIVSDWPWGIRENSFAQIQKLYPKFMKQMWIALRPQGRAFIVTQGHKLLNRILDYEWCQSMWTVDQIIPMDIGGLDVSLYILSKNPNPTVIPQDLVHIISN